jgi:FkbM family methyltransferase
MSYKRAFVSLLDRPGGRFLLGKLATRLIANGNSDCEIKYLDGMWTRRVGSHYLVDDPRFRYGYQDSSHWIDQFNGYIATTNEFWLRHYRPKEGDVIVDVGAGRGEDTFAFSRAVGKTGRVIAIEAHPVSFSVLENFCRANSLTNVTPVHLALMEKAGTVRMIESASAWTLNAISSGNGTAGVLVRSGTLDDLCQAQHIRNITFLKMNIEGAERYALLGMEEILPRIQQICVACHDFLCTDEGNQQFRTRAFVEKFLVNQGFRVVSRPDDPRDYVRDHLFGLRPL